MKEPYSRFAWDVFVSYTHQDKDIVVNAVKKLRKRLEQHDITIYFDQVDHPLEHEGGLGGGLSEGLATCRLFLIFISENYLASPWCLAESTQFFNSAAIVEEADQYYDQYFLGLPLNETFIPVFLPPDQEDTEELASFVMFKILPLWDSFLAEIAYNPQWPGTLRNFLTLRTKEIYIYQENSNDEDIDRVGEIIIERIAASNENLNESFKAKGKLIAELTPQELWKNVFLESGKDHWASGYDISEILNDFNFEFNVNKAREIIETQAENTLVRLLDGIYQRLCFVNVHNFIKRRTLNTATDNPGSYHSFPTGGGAFVFSEKEPPKGPADPHSIKYMQPALIKGDPLSLLFSLAEQGNIVEELQASYYQYLMMRPKDSLVDCSLLAAILVSDDKFDYLIFQYDTFKNDVLERIKAIKPITIY